jgi:uncharacterized protein (TIGR00251 family)
MYFCMATEKTKIWVQVRPSAHCNEVQGEKDGIWFLKIAAPPVRGRANQELVKFLSDVLQISRSNLEIEKGLTGRRKLMAISGLSLEQVRARFSNAVGQQRLS